MTLTEDDVFSALRHTWQPVALSTDLQPGTVTGYTLLEQELVIARFADGGLLAADVACPHKGARLSKGHLCDGRLQCPYHGWCFDSRGRCESIPSLVEPNAEKQALAALRTYPICERYGMIWVKLSNGDGPRGEPHTLPEIPEFEDPSWTYRACRPMVFASGWRREVENFVDMTHFAFAHRNTLGACADTCIRDLDISVTEDGGFLMKAPFPALENPHEPPGKLQSAHERTQRGWLPNFTVVRQAFNDGDQRLLLHVPSPNTRESCTCFWALAISPGFRGPSPDQQIEFATRVLEEDRAMCELQVPREVPINPARGGWGVLVMPGDKLANTFQKQLRRWLMAGTSELSGAANVER